jgi:uncharacterized protein YbcI
LPEQVDPAFSKLGKGKTVKRKIDLEAEISQTIIRFEKEFMGRGPLETRTYLLDELVVVRLKGVLTPAELKLAEMQDNQRGRYLLKQVRQELLDRGRPLLEAALRDILGVAIKSMHTDISTKTGERIIVFTLEERPRLLESEAARKK